ncbi:hypothetical protein [Novosphingobium sp. MBES04]|uniref:hypothetical protein n=1 Tax=Novosphingobium sp. MBES04 TaxID=1206458 RepID=UPI00058062F7|nr:hypothetical protein [Novosphingobium sp. MBES04]
MIFQAMTAAVLAALLPTTALAQIADIRSYSSVPPENLTSIMVLGTPHLSALEDVTLSHVKTVVDQIVAAKARVIGIERLSALEIVTMQASPVLAPALEQFVGPRLLQIAAAAQSRTGMGALEAAEVTSAWTSGSAGLSQEECLERLDISLAAYQPETALLYRERIAADALDQDAAHYLDTHRTSMNERVSVALAAARKLGLAKLWSIDSHLDKRLILPRMKELQAAFAKRRRLRRCPISWSRKRSRIALSQRATSCLSIAISTRRALVLRMCAGSSTCPIAWSSRTIWAVSGRPPGMSGTTASPRMFATPAPRRWAGRWSS